MENRVGDRVGRIRVRDLRAGDLCVLECPTSCEHGTQTLQAVYKGIKESRELFDEVARKGGLAVSPENTAEREQWRKMLEGGIQIAVFAVGGVNGCFEVMPDGKLTDGVGREIHILAAAHPGRG